MPASADLLAAAEQRPTREPVELLLRDLRSGPGGLAPREAARRLAVHGPNELPRPAVAAG